MRQITKNIFFVLLLICFFSILSFPQIRQTGTITGTVIDKEKNPLPGATIFLSGSALFHSRIYVTSDVGTFRFPALPPKQEYQIRVEMPGFRTITRPDLIVRVGQTTKIAVWMEMAVIPEEITVTSTSPTVDIESSKFNIIHSAELMDNIPMNRDLRDIQNSLPGAVSEGRPDRRTSSILGGTVRSVLYTLDGIPMNDPATFDATININVDVVEEIEFDLSSHPAEAGQADSAVINIVTKSGGAQFRGTIASYYTGEGLSEDLISKEDINTLNVDAPEKFTDYRDISINLSGPITKNKLRFFLNGRRLTWKQSNPQVPETRLQNIADKNPEMFSEEQLAHYDLSHAEWLGFAKLTFQPNPALSYTGMLHFNHLYEPVYSNHVNSTNSRDVTGIWNHENTFTTTHQFLWIPNQNTYLNFHGTYLQRNFPISSRPETHGNYTYYDTKHDVYWGAPHYDDEYTGKKVLASLSGTKNVNRLFGARHEFKAGFEFEQTEYHRDWYLGGGNPYYSYWKDFNANDPYYYSTLDQRGRLQVRFAPGERGMWDIQDNTRRFSGYIQDNLSTGRLAVNIGLRLDRSYQYEPGQDRPELRYTYPAPLQNPSLGTNELLEALIDQYHQETGPISPFDKLAIPYKKVVDFTTLSPRIGIIYDIFGTGKTALKLSFSRYYEPVWAEKYNASQILGPGSINWYWEDLNANKLMDLPGTDHYRLTDYREQNPLFQYYLPDLKAPYTNEYTIGIEHEVAGDFKLGFRFLYKLNKNLVENVDFNNGYDPEATDDNGLIWLPFKVIDPGWDGQTGTLDDAGLTIFGLRDDRPTKTFVGTNPPEARRRYWATILTFEKRMSNRWQLQGSLVYSSFKGNTSPEYVAAEGESEMFDDPNTLTHSWGSTAFDRPLQIKVMGTYILPFDMIISAYLQILSGTPWRRTFGRIYFPEGAPVQESYVSVPAEPNGSRRKTSFTNFDLRLEKTFSLRDFGKLKIYIDVFNAGGRSGVNINQDPAGWLRWDRTPAEYSTGPNYGLITSVYGVRSVRLGLRFIF